MICQFVYCRYYNYEGEYCVMKKVFGKELIVLWVCLAGLICAALSLNTSLNQLVNNGQEKDN